MAENRFPTIRDLRAALDSLVDRGLGDLPVQILIAPDSTIQALVRNIEPTYQGKPALMIDLTQGTDGRMPVAVISTARLSGDDRTTTVQ